MSRRDGEPRVVVALDFARGDEALALAARLDPALCRVKVGKELFTRAGPDVVRELVRLGFGVFLDLKFHDIPNTVAGACRAAADLGVWMVNVHASGGPAMLAAARAALARGGSAPLLVAVTVLTSLEVADLDAIGMHGDPGACVARLAGLAAAAELDGVVCSPHEISTVRAATPAGFLAVTPGIRPAGSAHGDQRRVTTPAEAMRAGADFLVIGRPVTGAADPLAALAAIGAEVDAALT